jgi:hypothetical protein
MGLHNGSAYLGSAYRYVWTQESTIIGLDNRDVQPDASLLALPNVRWVLGNLYAFYDIQGTYN